MVTNKRTTPPAVVTKKDALAALKIAEAYRQRKKGVTQKDALDAARKTSRYIRQYEAQVRAEAKRLGMKGSPATHLRKLLERELRNETRPCHAQTDF